MNPRKTDMVLWGTKEANDAFRKARLILVGTDAGMSVRLTKPEAKRLLNHMQASQYAPALLFADHSMSERPEDCDVIIIATNP